MAEVVNKSRNKIHQTWGPPSSRVLYKLPHQRLRSLHAPCPLGLTSLTRRFVAVCRSVDREGPQDDLGLGPELDCPRIFSLLSAAAAVAPFAEPGELVRRNMGPFRIVPAPLRPRLATEGGYNCYSRGSANLNSNSQIVKNTFCGSKWKVEDAVFACSVYLRQNARSSTMASR